MPTATERIAQRMAAAKKARTAAVRDIKDLAQQAQSRHDEIAAGKGNLSDKAREAALDALAATSDFCRAAAQQ